MEAYNRYDRVTEIVRQLNASPSRKAMEWYDNHSDLMKYYRENLGLYSELHPEIQDPTFRKKLECLDTLHDKLLMEYNTHRWFSDYDYLRYNETILWIVDWITSEDELCDLLVAVTI